MKWRGGRWWVSGEGLEVEREKRRVSGEGLEVERGKMVGVRRGY